jgi:hypothetical protein
MLRKIVVATAVGGALAASPAHADGWIAQHIIKPVFGDHAAREADKVHERLGKPLDAARDAAIATAAEAVLPGSGGVVAAGLGANRAAK